MHVSWGCWRVEKPTYMKRLECEGCITRTQSVLVTITVPAISTEASNKESARWGKCYNDRVFLGIRWVGGLEKALLRRKVR